MASSAYDEAGESERQETEASSMPEAASCTSLQDEAIEGAPHAASSEGSADEVTANSAAKRLKACPKCPQCQSANITTRGGGTHGKYRYSCHVCGTNWQQAPPHRAYSLERDPSISFRKRAVGQLYKCGRCGEPKKGHKCIYDSYPRGRAAGAAVVDPDVPKSTPPAAMWSPPHAAAQEACAPSCYSSACCGSYLGTNASMLPAPVYARSAGMSPMQVAASATHLPQQAPQFVVAPGYYPRENRVMVPQGYPPAHMARAAGVASMGPVMRVQSPGNGMLPASVVGKHGGMVANGHMRSVGRFPGPHTAMHRPATAPSALEHGMHVASGSMTDGSAYVDASTSRCTTSPPSSAGVPMSPAGMQLHHMPPGASGLGTGGAFMPPKRNGAHPSGLARGACGVDADESSAFRNGVPSGMRSTGAPATDAREQQQNETEMQLAAAEAQQHYPAGMQQQQLVGMTQADAPTAQNGQAGPPEALSKDEQGADHAAVQRGAHPPKGSIRTTNASGARSNSPAISTGGWERPRGRLQSSANIKRHGIPSRASAIHPSTAPLQSGLRTMGVGCAHSMTTSGLGGAAHAYYGGMVANGGADGVGAGASPALVGSALGYCGLVPADDGATQVYCRAMSADASSTQGFAGGMPVDTTCEGMLHLGVDGTPHSTSALRLGGGMHADAIDVASTGFAHGSLASAAPPRMSGTYAGAGPHRVSAEWADLLNSRQAMMARMQPSSMHSQGCCSRGSQDIYCAYPSEYRYYEQQGCSPPQTLMPMWPSSRG